MVNAPTDLLAKVEEVAPSLRPEMSVRLANLLDLVLDLQNRRVQFQPVLVLNQPKPDEVAQVLKLAEAYTKEGYKVQAKVLDDMVILEF